MNNRIILYTRINNPDREWNVWKEMAEKGDRCRFESDKEQVVCISKSEETTMIIRRGSDLGNKPDDNENRKAFLEKLWEIAQEKSGYSVIAIHFGNAFQFEEITPNWFDKFSENNADISSLRKHINQKEGPLITSYTLNGKDREEIKEILEDIDAFYNKLKKKEVDKSLAGLRHRFNSIFSPISYDLQTLDETEAFDEEIRSTYNNIFDSIFSKASNVLYDENKGIKEVTKPKGWDKINRLFPEKDELEKLNLDEYPKGNSKWDIKGLYILKKLCSGTIYEINKVRNKDDEFADWFNKLEAALEALDPKEDA